VRHILSYAQLLSVMLSLYWMYEGLLQRRLMYCLNLWIS